MFTKERLALTKERFMHTKSPYDFRVNFLGYTRLNLTNLLINLLGLSWLNLGLFLCEGNFYLTLTFCHTSRTSYRLEKNS